MSESPHQMQTSSNDSRTGKASTRGAKSILRSTRDSCNAKDHSAFKESGPGAVFCFIRTATLRFCLLFLSFISACDDYCLCPRSGSNKKSHVGLTWLLCCQRNVGLYAITRSRVYSRRCGLKLFFFGCG